MRAPAQTSDDLFLVTYMGVRNCAVELRVSMVLTVETGNSIVVHHSRECGSLWFDLHRINRLTSLQVAILEDVDRGDGVRSASADDFSCFWVLECCIQVLISEHVCVLGLWVQVSKAFISQSRA